MSQRVSIGKLRVLTINDVYAFQPVQGLGGYAEISTLIQQYRTDHCLLFINGDFLGGSPLAEHFQGKCVVEVLDQLGVDYCVIGNHEFDFGNDALQQRIHESRFRWLGSNIRQKESGELFGGVTDTAIEKFTFQLPNSSEERTVKVGLFGVCTESTPVLSWPGKDVAFHPVLECATQKSAELRGAECDLVIAVTHVDLSEDHEIAEQNHDVQLILGGHEHFPYNHVTKHGTLIFKAGQNAYWLGVIDFDLELHRKTDASGHVTETITSFPSWQMVANRGNLPDPAVAKIIDQYRQEKEKADAMIDKSEVICTVVHQPLITKTSVVRCGSAQVLNVAVDAVWKRYCVHGEYADLAILNGGIIRGDSIYPPGTQITRGILMEEVPFPLQLAMMNIQGRYIKEALEQHLRKYPTPNGSYPHISGNLSVIVNGDEHPMQRIQSIHINGEPMEDDRVYKLATTRFLSIGGDNCSGYTHGEVFSTEDVKFFDVFLEYMKSLSQLDATLEERLKVV